MADSGELTSRRVLFSEVFVSHFLFLVKIDIPYLILLLLYGFGVKDNGIDVGDCSIKESSLTFCCPTAIMYSFLFTRYLDIDEFRGMEEEI